MELRRQGRQPPGLISTDDHYGSVNHNTFLNIESVAGGTVDLPAVTQILVLPDLIIWRVAYEFLPTASTAQ